MKIEALKKKLVSYTVILASLLLVQCDKDDDYVYPSVRTDFMDVYTDAESRIDRIQTDASPVLRMTNPLATHLRPDTAYRAVGMYSVPDAEKNTAVYSITLIYSAVPYHGSNLKSYHTDPVYMESVFRGGNYLNISVRPMVQDQQKHRYAFVEDSVVLKGGYRMVYLTLAHNKNEDRESFPRTVYLSVPLQQYGMSKGDSICFRANLYEKGMSAWKFPF